MKIDRLISAASKQILSSKSLLRDGASREALEELSLRVMTEFDVRLPEEHLVLLGLMDGFYENELIVFSSGEDTTSSAKPKPDHEWIDGLVQANALIRADREADRFDHQLILAEDGIFFYLFDDQKKHYLLQPQAEERPDRAYLTYLELMTRAFQTAIQPQFWI